MVEVKGGLTFYGQAIGIMMLDTQFPRILGDIGNAQTWPFPVRYKVVHGASPQRVVREKSEGLLEPFLDAARELEKEGVKAITTSCGFLIIFQRRLAEEITIPVFTSSLLQIPLAYRMLGKERKIGVITVDARYLTKEYLEAAGAESVPVIITGIEGGTELTRVLIEDEPVLDAAKAEADVVNVAKRLVTEYPEVGAIVLECTNMPPYAKAVQNAVQRPVFDIVTLTKWVYASVVQRAYF